MNSGGVGENIYIVNGCDDQDGSCLEDIVNLEYESLYNDPEGSGGVLNAEAASDTRNMLIDLPTNLTYSQVPENVAFPAPFATPTAPISLHLLNNNGNITAEVGSPGAPWIAVLELIHSVNQANGIPATVDADYNKAEFIAADLDGSLVAQAVFSDAHMSNWNMSDYNITLEASVFKPFYVFGNDTLPDGSANSENVTSIVDPVMCAFVINSIMYDNTCYELVDSIPALVLPVFDVIYSAFINFD